MREEKGEKKIRGWCLGRPIYIRDKGIALGNPAACGQHIPVDHSVSRARESLAKESRAEGEKAKRCVRSKKRK